MLDFVYIIKKSETNIDLQYSLRTIAKNYPDHKIWIVGYKPSWVNNVGYIPVEQSKDKWKNSVNNIIKACENDEISDDFILMNDDFFAVKPKYDLDIVINSNLGTLDDAVKKYSGKKTPWAKAFSEVDNLLKKLNVKKPYYNYEAHLPIKINKKKFLEVISLPEVQEFMKTNQVLHKRTLYKNYDKQENSLSFKNDVKIFKTEKNKINEKLDICGWLSVADGVVGNSECTKINYILKSGFPNYCIYEKPNSQTTRIKIKKKIKFF